MDGHTGRSNQEFVVMANEVREVENTKDNTAKSSEDNQVSYLSVISDIGKSAVLGGIGCAAAAGIGEACKTATGSESALKTGMKIGTCLLYTSDAADE